ncbi:MAG TPA: universal stress protein [Moraxellaceae bacterium]|nr:universal stress protein [Moraxellaceae bacterium]
MYQNILVAVDGSPASRRALEEALRMAPPGATLRVVSVVENPMWSVPLEQGVVYDVELVHQALVKAGQEILAGAQQQLAARGATAETRLLDLFEHDNSIPGAILAEAEACKADVIVLGTHGRRGLRRLLMGSVAEAVLRDARRPVLLVHGAD